MAIPTEFRCGANSALPQSARHGINAPRGQDVASLRGGRFGRMFDLPACDAGPGPTGRLVERIEKSSVRHENMNMAAGVTYLGQFIDHDITFDPTSKLHSANDPHVLVNGRTPRFDLDSVYGSGSADQPFLYDWAPGSRPGVKLLVGGGAGDAACATRDLPRNHQGRALIGDARNDEHLIIAQLHLLFLDFHNKVVDWLDDGTVRWSDGDLFEEAQRIVRWHYQWIVVHDFLPKVVGEDVAQGVPHGAPSLGTWRGEPAIPVEFSAAAFRFGHSMVREAYNTRPDTIQVPIIPVAGQIDGRHLGGFRRLPSALEINWNLFFFDTMHQPHNANVAMAIDLALTPALFELPPDHASLVRLNLERGQALGLPSGRDVAMALGVTPLRPEQLRLDSVAIAQILSVADRDALKRSPPLWYYILCEALALEGERLGDVGGRIVAAVLISLLDGDPNSYARKSPGWKPVLPRAHDDLPAGDFTMIDLVAFTKHGP